MENIWKKVEKEGGRNLKSTQVRKGSREAPKDIEMMEKKRRGKDKILERTGRKT